MPAVTQKLHSIRSFTETRRSATTSKIGPEAPGGQEVPGSNPGSPTKMAAQEVLFFEPFGA
jgi:hypothetical protein